MVKIRLLLIFFILFFITFFAWRFRAPSNKSDRPLIVCTTGMISDMLKAIAGDQFEIKALMGPGVDPHLYRARESDLHALSRADFIFYNGLHLEGKMGDLFCHMNQYAPTVAVARDFSSSDLVESDFAGIYDPHVWHDTALWQQAVFLVRDQLIAHDRIHQKQYEEQAALYLEHLSDTVKYVKKRIAELPKKKRILITAHDAFAYFGKAYDFKVIGLQGISTDAMVTARDIQQIADIIVEKKVRSIFLEASIPSRSIEAVQNAVKARGWHVEIAPELFSDSLGDESTTAHTYCGMIKQNVDTIVDALT